MLVPVLGVELDVEDGGWPAVEARTRPAGRGRPALPPAEAGGEVGGLLPAVFLLFLSAEPEVAEAAVVPLEDAWAAVGLMPTSSSLALSLIYWSLSLSLEFRIGQRWMRMYPNAPTTLWLLIGAGVDVERTPIWVSASEGGRTHKKRYGSALL